MTDLTGKVAIVTGAGAGIGRECALYLAREGAQVVVNDLAVSDVGPAAALLAAEIRDAGGEAIADTGSVTDPDSARALVEKAITTYGTLDVLVNNAGILRDRMLVNMTLDEWEAIMAVHLRGAFLTTQRAAEHWRERSRAGEQVSASVINMTSGSGLHAAIGQSNYAAAKSGVATFTMVIAKELGRYGVRANAVAPTARTQLTSTSERLVEIMKPPEAPAEFDEWHPRNLAPVVAWLASPACPLTGQVLGVFGDRVGIYQPWTVHHMLDNNGAEWDAKSLTEAFADSEATPASVGMM